MTWSNVKCQPAPTAASGVSNVVAELLPVLLVLYPLLLLLDDLEPGFVRRAFNPHLLLPVLLVVGMLAGRGERDHVPSVLAVRGVAFAGAVLGGAWVWVRLRPAGTLAVVVALLAAVAIGAAVYAISSPPDS